MIMVIVAWLAAALVFATFFMKTIVPLRMLAIASNVAFITYGLLGIAQGIGAQLMPILVLHVALLPLNVLRLREVRTAIRTVRALKTVPPAADFLI